MIWLGGISFIHPFQIGCFGIKRFWEVKSRYRGATIGDCMIEVEANLPVFTVSR